ncbi:MULTISPECIES: hypothetical protein [unclassified Variovorax]|uniref:hypothetical protein n=1 Tax=unclassified Variovorax TaxID=663243 RepID=UPI000838C2E3|nr:MULTISPECIES: hypothetical protein [unclassified Variovorax]VTV18778.1 hypothetical protein WDL1P2_00424 [Variovorax sp. WDL1]
MQSYELMTAARSRGWLALCAGVARETLQLAGHGPTDSFVPHEDEFFASPMKAGALGLLLQWACEDNESYAATFGPIAFSESALCPFHQDGIGFAVNVVRNGMLDDWEIFAHWGQGGYVIVPDWQRQDADRRFDFAWAPDWLYRRCGGARDAAELPGDVRDALHVRAIELAVADGSEELAEAPRG